MVANFVYRYRIRLDYSDKPVSTRGSRVKTEKLHNADLVRLFGVTKRPQQDCNLRYEVKYLSHKTIDQHNVAYTVYMAPIWGQCHEKSVQTETVGS